jgi:hypothetical protein
MYPSNEMITFMLYFEYNPFSLLKKEESYHISPLKYFVIHLRHREKFCLPLQIFVILVLNGFQ